MKILFLSDNFYPEVNAPANRTYEHCREWRRLGAEVTVITCVPNFPRGKVFNGYKNKLVQTETIDGIRVVRVWSFISANEGKVKRILDYVSYAFTSLIASLFYKSDIIIATSPQFFTALSGSLASFFKRTPWIMEVRDIWPESIVAVGAMGKSKTIHFLEKIEKYLYRSARKVVVVTDSFKQNLIGKGVSDCKIHVVKNGVNLAKFVPIPKNEQILDKYGLRDKFVIGYFGTHGMAHKLDFILQSAKKITDSGIHILLIGDGAEKSHLLQLKEKLQLKNVTMLASVSKDEMQQYISTIDVALVNLRKSDTFKSVIPSKIFENAAMLKPILLGVEGESQAIIEQYQSGICFEPENEKDFLEKLSVIKSSYNDYLKGCKQLATDFDRTTLAIKMYNIIQN